MNNLLAYSKLNIQSKHAYVSIINHLLSNGFTWDESCETADTSYDRYCTHDGVFLTIADRKIRIVFWWDWNAWPYTMFIVK